MQTLAEKVYDIVRMLPESRAAEILSFAEAVQAETETRTEENDFFALAGLWRGRDINPASLRKKAWPEHSP